tara:strand:+ start:573 stop:863 length:291 start_codon:yes stop_codon:yes gene_type:complete
VAVNLRNKPIDKRRLKAEDRGFDTSRRTQALARARQRRGQAAYENNRQPNTTLRYKGRNAFAPGIRAQQMRMQELSAQKARNMELRPPKEPLPDIF